MAESPRAFGCAQHMVKSAKVNLPRLAAMN